MSRSMAWDFSFGHMSGQKWRDHRRIFHQYFNQIAVKKYRSVQLNEIRSLLGRILDSPAQTAQHVRLWVEPIHRCFLSTDSQNSTFASIIMRIVYGKRITALEDEFLYLAHKGVEGLSIERVPGAFWIEYFPFFKNIPSWVPGAKFKQVAEHYKPIVQQMVNLPFDDALKATVRDQVTFGMAT